MPSMMAWTASGVERATSVSSMRRMNLPLAAAGVGPGEEGGAGAADVGGNRWGWGETGADLRPMKGPGLGTKAAILSRPAV